MEENKKLEVKGGKISPLKLAKAFSASSRFSIPRAVFMLMLYCFFCAFFSSLMTGLAVTVSSFFLKYQGGVSLSILVFLFIELLSMAIIFVIHYGLFLCNLRFVRNQPVALSFLFAGLRQRRARRGAAFFVIPMILCMVIFAVVTNNVDFFALPQFQTPEQLMDFVKQNPDSLKKFLACFILFLLLAFLLYFPFTFVWSFVYDNNKDSFFKSLLKGLKFFGRKIFHFLAFIFVCHFRKAVLIFALDFLHAFIYNKYQSSANIYSFGSLVSFFAFAYTFYTAASIILSIQFYYDKLNEDTNQASSN